MCQCLYCTLGDSPENMLLYFCCMVIAENVEKPLTVYDMVRNAKPLKHEPTPKAIAQFSK